MSSDKEFTLYSYWRSGTSWRVRAALHHKNIDFDYVAVNLVKGEQRSAEYLEKNPSGLVPTLVHRGVLLTQSPAILEYLEEIHPENPLLPKDPVSRAKVRALVGIIACDTHPVQNLSIIKEVARLRGKEGVDTEFAKWVNVRGLTAYEKAVGQTMGKYSFGDEFTIADICLAAQFYNANRFEVDLTPFPNIVKLMKEINEVPCIKKSHPSAQPDATA
ncbi:Maleylacetoacetate isomerase [Rhizoclosmatium globosum]|uniref:Maleylacetoacetate isomerase n=1 Tax=Rhizoclosmatium globosum TaxID=329046 RepID=A0A1Y2CB17_9FUNG|nr:Maleylacetoacetate isomerase [Rhizoclosmatium globosum]|eukprot:ORY44126.1 Maleylacetoacetate isomerase [Rhizoclosmatium globosum]